MSSRVPILWPARGRPVEGADPIGLLADAASHLPAPALDDPDA
ncbi:hypothetical protein ABZ914_25310 [Spirillospora sp. NPDC046719]